METKQIPERKKKEGNNIDYDALNRSIKQKNKILEHNAIVFKGTNTK